jgi:hypothetical protein
VTPYPADAKIYHITHINNLPKIINAGYLFSDAECLRLGVTHNIIGMDDIKLRRLNELTVSPPYPETKVGEYVPFYFCSHSVMLHKIKVGGLGLSYPDG